MLRPATVGDILRMVELGRLFFLEARLDKVMSYDDDSAAGTFAALLDNPDGAIFVMERDGLVVGGIGVLLAPHYFNLQHKTGQELFWYVLPDYRGTRESLDLVLQLETWARDHGAQSLAIARMATSPKALGRIYERRGFMEMETHHMGRL